MKAIYSKPLLAVEVFSATQPTARDCADFIPSNRVTNTDIVNCGWDIGYGEDMLVFSLEYVCKIDGEGEYGCYNNPSEGNYIFRS